MKQNKKFLLNNHNEHKVSVNELWPFTSIIQGNSLIMTFHMTTCTYEDQVPYIVWKTKYLTKVTSSWVTDAVFHRFWLITLLNENILFIKSSKVFNTYNAVYQIQGFCFEYSFTGSLKRKKNVKVSLNCL